MSATAAALGNLDLGGKQASSEPVDFNFDNKEEEKKDDEPEKIVRISEKDNALKTLVDFTDLKKDKIAAEKEEE